MTDGPGQTVDDGFLIFVNMAMGMGDALGMEMDMILVIGHRRCLLCWYEPQFTCHYILFPHFPQAPVGDIPTEINILTDASLAAII